MALVDPETASPTPGELGIPVLRADLGGNAIEIVESQTSRWLFDPVRGRMLRLPRDVGLDVGILTLPWQRYTAVRLDDGGAGVVVTLDGGGRLRLGALGNPAISP